MKPNDPGVWYARDGRVLVARSYKGRLWVNVFTPAVGEISGLSFAGYADTQSDLLEGDWIKAEPPKFPELPVLHYRVLAKASPTAKFQFTGTHWFYFEPKLGEFHGGRQGYWAPRELEVCAHPKNDPEAVKLIEEAQRAVCSR